MNEQSCREQRNKSALRSGVWYTISSVSVKTILIITTPIFTRLMSTTDYGMSATFATWFALLNVICSLNLWYSIGRAKLDFPGKLDEFVGSIQLLVILFTTAVGVVSYIFLDEVSHLLEMNKSLVIALFIYLLAFPAVQLTQAKFKYLYNYKGNIAITIYTTLATVVLSLIFVLILSNQRALGKSLGAVVSAVLLAVIIWIYTLKNGLAKCNIKYWKYALIICLPLILNSISLNILAQSDRIFITKYCGTNYTGIYSLAYSYAILINIVLNAVNEAWLPWFHDSLNDNQVEQIRRNVKPLIVFGCWFGIGCIAIAPEAIAALGGEAYSDGVRVVPPVALGVVCSYIFQQYEHIELHMKKTWFISLGTIIAATINIVLNYIFVQIFGFVAAAYTTLICYLILMVIHHFISRFILKVHLYEDKFMYMAIGITFIFTIVFTSMYHLIWIWRWILMAVISTIYLYKNRKEIVLAIQKMRKK